MFAFSFEYMNRKRLPEWYLSARGIWLIVTFFLSTFLVFSYLNDARSLKGKITNIHGEYRDQIESTKASTKSILENNNIL